MASTQELTKLPVVQYTGMDYSTVISEIKNIIDNNKNWKSNWTQFYSSEAGTMLVQLMAWICDNLAVRQDLLYNEGFLSTAQSNNSKYRLLQQIGYFLKGTNGATANISISLEQPTGENIYLSNHRDNAKEISSIKNKILRFKAPDINGKEVNWEILRKDEDGNILYTEEVLLLGNATYYETGVTDVTSRNTYQLNAIQGETNYFEFSSDEEGDVVFNLGLTECDTNTIAVYDIEKATKHIRVNSFQELCVLTKEEIERYSCESCYILERNENGYLQIRYPSTALIENNAIIANYAYKPGKKIGVFVRTSKGSDGNILANYFEAKATVKTEGGNSVDIVIRNELDAYGGKNSEALEDAIKTAPLDLRLNNRAVTIEDFDRVLQQNDFILNSVSYSPYNEPKYFEKYYGRQIYPHETFGFISSNKNFKNIPVESLNYFPWVDTTKEHVLNEYYNFFNCEINQEFNHNGKTFINSFIQKTVDKQINGQDDSGFDNNWVAKGDKAYEFYSNGVVYETSSKLLSTINSELNFNDENKLFMEVKVHSENFDGLYLKEIRNNLFSNVADTDFTFRTKDNIILDDKNYSATFTSGSIFEEAINVRDYSAIHIVIDDNIDLEVNLLKELPFDKLEECKEYYLMLSNNTYYDETKIDNLTKDYFDSSEISKYRRGIIELCKDALEAYLKDPKNYLEVARINNKVKYLDLGLQIPESSFDNFNPETDLSDLLITDGFYRIKINNDIYAFKLNKDTLEKASNFYNYVMYDHINASAINVFKNIENGNVLNTNVLSDDGMEINIHDTIERNNWQAYYDEIEQDCLDRGISSVEAKKEAEAGANKKVNEDAKKVFEEYKKNKIAITENSCYEELSASHIRFEDCIKEDNTVSLTVDKLATFLAYVFSPYNVDKDVLFKYNNGWVEIDNHKENVAGGNLKISLVSRIHCNDSTYLTLDKYKDSDFIEKTVEDDYTLNYPNKEFDVRFDYIGDNNFSISSVSEKDIENNTETKDFLQTLFGFRKTVKSYTTPEFELEDIFYIDSLDGYKKLVVKSPRTGYGSTLNFYGDGELKQSFVNKVLDCPYITVKQYGEKFIWFTGKACGVRRLEMFVNKSNPSYLARNGELKTDMEINNGDFIFVDNDLNFVNTPETILISYKLSPVSSDGKLNINHRDNFYYVDSNDEKINYITYCRMKGIEPMVAIEGAAVYTNEVGKQDVNESLSKWSIKLTKKPYSDTNSYYAIEEDPLVTLNVAPCDNISLVTAKIEPSDKNFIVPLIFGIDSDEGKEYQEIINANTDVMVDVNLAGVTSLGLLESIQSALMAKRILLEEDISSIYSLRRSICRSEKDDSNKLVFTNINVNNGNIIFKYPNEKIWNPENNKQEQINLLYKTIFGTNISNPEFYKLYPAECMDSENVVYIDENEYYFAPVYKEGKIHNLIFKYRTLEPRDGLGNVGSRYADFYIEAEKFENDYGFTFNYKLCKTKTAEFPDVGFYLHYVHDRTLMNETNLEENKIQRYLNKYMIAGTDYNILKPCFKSFDIEGKVYYNANFIEKNIREAINKNLEEKYQLKNIHNIIIDNKIYLSDIMKLITSVDGVEHVDITYFGLDVKQKTKYPSQTSYIKLDDDISFYTMLVLSDKNKGHGINLLYEKTE